MESRRVGREGGRLPRDCVYAREGVSERRTEGGRGTKRDPGHRGVG